MVGGSNVFAPNDPAPHFSIVYGLHNRKAFLRSSPIVLPADEDWMRVTIDRGSPHRAGRRGTEGSRRAKDAGAFEGNRLQDQVDRRQHRSQQGGRARANPQRRNQRRHQHRRAGEGAAHLSPAKTRAGKNRESTEEESSADTSSEESTTEREREPSRRRGRAGATKMEEH